MDYKLSLYQPVEVEIDGQKFKLRRLNRSMFQTLAEFAKKEEAAKNDAFATIDVVYEELKAFVDAPPEVLDNLDQQQVLELKKIIDQVVFKKQAPGAASPAEDPEKNGPKPGEETAVL